MSFALVAFGPMPGPQVQVSHVWCERMGNSQTKHTDTIVCLGAALKSPFNGRLNWKLICKCYLLAALSALKMAHKLHAKLIALNEVHGVIRFSLCSSSNQFTCFFVLVIVSHCATFEGSKLSEEDVWCLPLPYDAFRW